jgi:hypothetical protein
MERKAAADSEGNRATLLFLPHPHNEREMMIEAVYKCRHCGGIYCPCAVSTEEMAAKEIYAIIDNKPICVTPQRAHQCNDNQIGLADFIGFRKKGEVMEEKRTFGDDICQNCNKFRKIPYTERYTAYHGTPYYCAEPCEYALNSDDYKFKYERELSGREYWYHQYEYGRKSDIVTNEQIDELMSKAEPPSEPEIPITIKDAPRKEPIIEFESEEQARECLREWQTRLFLDDWVIQIAFDSEIQAYAEVEKAVEKQSAVIRIRPLDSITGTKVTRYCAEKSVVHELLHLKLDLVDYQQGDLPIEVVVFDYTQHQKIEQLSKAFIMAKYGLGFDWFRNF